MHEFVVFSKLLRGKTVDQLIEIAQQNGFDGYDLCVRPNYPVNPDNAAQVLPDAARRMAQAGLSIPMVTANFDLLSPDHPTAEPILAAMDSADIRLIKLGYFLFNPYEQDYWAEVDRIRHLFEGWQTLARRYHVKVCYHTHNDRCMGLNGAALAHLVNGFDPQAIGAYVDPTHLILEGEEFAMAAAMVQKYLSIVAMKDVLKFRVQKEDHGAYGIRVMPAGEGMVDWTAVFTDLRRLDYAGPFTVHCEWEDVDEAEWFRRLPREIAFFKHQHQKFFVQPEAQR